jgi:single-strand DNA-binding protein
MKGLNEVRLLGNLTAAPEVRSTPQGDRVASFALACGKPYKDKASGEFKENTQFIRVCAWGYRAEYAEKYLAKGDRALVKGELQTRQYEKNGQKHYLTEVKADDIIALGGKRGGEGSRQNAPASNYASGRAAAPSYPEREPEPDFPLDFDSLPGGESDCPF